MWVFRGDLTYFQEGGRARTSSRPASGRRRSRSRRDQPDRERRVHSRAGRQRDPNNPAAGLVPFYRRYETPSEVLTTAGRDRDYAVYVQDSWKPHPRITANFGVRADFVRRFDEIFGVERMNSMNVGPRLGMSYLVTRMRAT